MVLLLLGLVFLLNSVINLLALRAVGVSWRVAVLAGFALAQVGEFAFVLSATGVASGLIRAEAERLVVAVIALTMIMSPMWLELARRLQGWVAAERAAADRAAVEPVDRAGARRGPGPAPALGAPGPRWRAVRGRGRRRHVRASRDRAAAALRQGHPGRRDRRRPGPPARS